MKSDSVKTNFIFQFLYQCIIMLIPLIVAPYLARTLGQGSLGTYTYINSIVSYFIILCNLGISKYGQRVIAERKDDEVKLRKTFWSLYIFHILSSVVGLIAYILFCGFFHFGEVEYYIQGLFIISCLLDCSWLFYGIESFKEIVIRNGIIKLIEALVIFLCIKSSNDLIIYTLIMSISNLVSSIILIPIVLKKIQPIKFCKNDFLEHGKPLLVLSISVVAISLYTIFDKTLLGLLSTKDNVAFYEYSNKIIMIPKIFLGIVGTVLFPRACNLMSNKNNINKIIDNLNKSLSIILFMGIGASLGLFAIADPFAKLYYGDAFSICGSIIKTMTPLILIMGIGDIFRMQILIPNHKDVQYIICIIVNAIINIILSLLLIPKIGVYGAVIGTVSAEIFGVVIQGYLVKEFISFKNIIFCSIPYFVSAGAMLIVIYLIQSILELSLFSLFNQIIFGACTYVLLNLIWFCCFDKNRKNNIIYISNIKNTILKKIKKY